MRIASTLLLAVAFSAVAYSQEPEFRGRSIAEWADLIQAEDEAALSELRWTGEEANAVLLPLLDHSSPTVRRHALRLLIVGSWGKLPLSADRLGGFLHDDDAGARAWAARGLARYGAAAWFAVDALVHCLGDEDEDVRYAAIYALGKIGKPAGRALAKALGDTRAFVRAGAAEALCEFESPPVRSLIRASEDSDPVVRAVVARALGHVQSGQGRAVPALVALLTDEHVAVRRIAARALGWYEAQALPAREALVAALKDEDAEVRAAAANAMGHMEKDPATLSAIVAAIDDPDPRVRGNAVHALRYCEELSDEAIQAIGRAANDPELTVRESTAWALLYIGDRARPAIPAVVRSLQYDDARRIWRLRTYFKASAARSIAAMRDALTSEDAATRLAGLRGLQVLGRVPIAEEIAPLLSNDPNPFVRLTAARSLARLRDRAAKAIPDLVAALEDAEPSVRLAAGQALSAVGQAAVPALIHLLEEAEGEERTRIWALFRAMAPEVRLPRAFLLAALNSGDLEWRENAAESLFRIEGDDLDPIRHAMKDRSVAVRLAAARAWIRRSDDPAEALPILIGGLDAKNADHRLFAAQALEELARETRAVPEALCGLLGDPALAVRRAAGDAIFAVDLRLGLRARELSGLEPRDSSFGVNPNSVRWDTPQPSSLMLLAWAIRSAPPSRRWEAARDLSLLGEVATGTAPDLAKSLRADCERSREWAARALAAVGSADKSVVESLEAALEDEDPAVRADAPLALWKATGNPEAALASLRRQLTEGDATARWHAVRALREMGAESKEVERAIRIAIDDEDEIVRLAARSALRQAEEGRDR